MSNCQDEQSGTQSKEDHASTRASIHRDLSALFAHDLCNPLQSITVLLEFIQDEVPAHSDASQRLEQCIHASAQMRQLLHGYTKLIKERRVSPEGNPLQAILDRSLEILAGRAQRSVIKIIRDTALVDAIKIQDPNLEFAFTSLFLSLITASRHAKNRCPTLEIKGSIDPQGRAKLSLILSHFTLETDDFTRFKIMVRDNTRTCEWLPQSEQEEHTLTIDLLFLQEKA